MGSRRYVVVGAVAAAALLTGLANASAAPSDTADRRAVEVQNPLASAARAAAAEIPSQYVPVNPVRVLDTRTSGAPVGRGGVVTVDLTARTPANATAVILNVTAIEPSAPTWVAVWPATEERPLASNLNVFPGQVRANQVSVGLDPADRRISLYNNEGTTHLMADLAGYYIDGAATRYNFVRPGRLLDTRNTGGPVGGQTYRDVDVSWLPDTVTAVTFNLTAVDATTPTWVAAYPAGSPQPLASTLNLNPGEVVPNQVTVRLNANQKVRLFNNGGFVHLLFDMVGYYDTAGGSHFVPITPERALDTRETGPTLNPGIYVALGPWPDNFTGVAANLTGTNSTAPQYVTVYPGGQTPPATSNLNLFAGQTAANAVNAGIGFEPAVGENAINFTNNNGNVDIIFDVAGFFVRV